MLNCNCGYVVIIYEMYFKCKHKKDTKMYKKLELLNMMMSQTRVNMFEE